MSNNKSLPDFIEVANIKNLFWNNNSDLYPTCVPTNYITIEKTRPTFYSPYIGTCVLVGEFNHCLYNGNYYFLTKLEVLDVMTSTYKYQLDYDVMINFISAGVNIKGTLIRTDREDILEASLQTTKPILADPVEKKTFTTIKDSKPKQEIDII